ncbi:hypothetical protein LEP1GSC137_2259 [Leptospira borgpetersenii str. Noumea 25]|nr:hypothetical protein LEP1GSC137_2259 [Leptospira borgpetersenii str. Noumea 25]
MDKFLVVSYNGSELQPILRKRESSKSKKLKFFHKISNDYIY